MTTEASKTVDIIIPMEGGKEAEKKPRSRRVVDRETVAKSMINLQKKVEKEMENIKNRPDNSKATGIRFLKTVNKELKILSNDYKRVLKQKPKNKRKPDTQYGFMMPVKISEEMANFIKSPPEQLLSRVQVTKKLCEYIKENKLQHEKDKRFIIPNDALKTLLRYDPQKNGTLTYYTLQKFIQCHFPKSKRQIEAEKKEAERLEAENKKKEEIELEVEVNSTK